MKRLLWGLLTLLLSLAVGLSSTAEFVYAGGGRIELSSQAGVANGQAASVKAIIRNEEMTQFSAGEEGEFSFQNAQSGQSCSTPNKISNSNGEVSGTCTSPITGQFVVLFRLTNGDERTVSVSFNPAPTPTPAPQSVSGQYKLDLTDSNITFSNEINTGYGVNAILKDSTNNQVIVNQGDVEFSWVSQNNDIVRIRAVDTLCVSPTQPPCPRINGHFEGYKPGTTSVKVTAKKGGQTIAEASVTVNITQAAKDSRYTPSINAATTSPTPTPTTTPKASASPKATPKTSATPAATTTASPGTEEMTIDTDSSPQPTPSASPTPSANTRKFQLPLELILIVAGIVLGLGIPLGMYYLETHPAAKTKLQHRLAHYRTKLRSLRKKS